MSTISSNKGYTVPSVNADSGTWGGGLNTALGLIDQNLGGSQSISLAAGNVAANTSQAANLITTLTGVLTGDTEYILPSGFGGVLIFNNQTTGGHNAVIASAGGGTTVTISQPVTKVVYSDGTNVVDCSAYLPLIGGSIAGNVLVAGGVAATSTAISISGIVTGSGVAAAGSFGVTTPGTQSLVSLFSGVTQVGAIFTDGTTTTYGTTSDRRLKVDGALMSGDVSGAIVDRLLPRWFRWKAGAKDAVPEPGFFAQELARVFPWAVRKGRGRPGQKGFVPWTADAGKLMPVVVAELQALRARVAELERAGRRVRSSGTAGLA